MARHTLFDYAVLADALARDLEQVAACAPNERLPKEEQIRSRAFAFLLPIAKTVCVERGYASVDQKSSIEVDLWSSWAGEANHWLEIKRCWHVRGRGWNNKASEQRGTWIDDMKKLSKAPSDDHRALLLVGFFDRDPCTSAAASESAVVEAISSLAKSNEAFKCSYPFAWRGSPVSHVGVWSWAWGPGERIAI